MPKLYTLAAMPWQRWRSGCRPWRSI